MVVNIPVKAIVRLPHPRTGDIQGQETFLTLSGDNKTVTMTKSAQTTIPPY